MSYLNDFQDEHRALIVSIPVRAGFWMSHIDDVPGERDDQKERIGLELALKKIMSKTGDTAFTNDVAEFALSSLATWPAWEDKAGTMLDDLPKALKLVETTLPPDALKSYKKMIYFIANVVAQAASEAGAHSSKTGGLTATLDRLSVKTDMTMPENVSKIEKAALQKLLTALKA